MTAIVAHVLFLTFAPRAPLVEMETPSNIVDEAADTTIAIDSNTDSRSPQTIAPAPGIPAQMRPSDAAHIDNATRSTPGAPPAGALQPPQIENESDSDDEQEKPSSTATTDAPTSPGVDPVKPSSPAPPSDEYGSLPPTDSAPGVPGLSGPLWAVPGVVPSTEAPKPAPTTITAAPIVPGDIASRVLSGTMHSRDKSIGIEVPAAGVVATSVADAVRNSSLTDTKGTFEVKLDGQGNVQSVRFVGSTDGDASQWSAIADSVRRSFAGRSLQMGPDKQGVTVVVKVESKVQYPAGTKEKVDVKPICANDVVEQIVQAIEGSTQTGGMVHGIRDDQGHFIPYSELDDERRIKFCIPIGIRGRGDLSNIGAHMTNVVSSSFQVKRSGEVALPSEDVLPIDRRAPWLPADPGKTRPPPPPPKKKNKKPRTRRGSIVPVQLDH